MTAALDSRRVLDHTPVLERLRGAVRAHPFIAYIVVAYAVSWTWWGGQALRGEIVTPGGSQTHLPGLLGPLTAAFVVTALVGGRAGVGDLVARMLRWRVGLRWYALAFLPFAVFLVGIVAQAAVDGVTPNLAGLGRYSGIPEIGIPAVALLAFGFNGFGEEVGWRGFAQPTLRRGRGLVAACLGVALAWGIWHVPSFAIVETYRLMGFGIVPMFVVGLGSGAIVFGWLYERANSSILVVALAHLALNMGSATAAGRGLPGALVTTVIVAWAAVIVAVEWQAARRTRAAVDARAAALRIDPAAGARVASATAGGSVR